MSGIHAFYRGTTPTHKFTLCNVSLSTLENVRICYTQDDDDILIKTLSDCMKENDNMLSIKLTQEETNIFRVGECKLQLRVKTLGGQVLSSKQYVILCRDSLDDEVM
ncbi:MAG: hypothetical protein E7269_04750 [Lachnospiraceae bacterium]|nr:hypothetical protein [Lachnospiraceae bacterium]